MTIQTVYLSPGFFITMGEKRQSYIFSQLPGLLKRVSPARLMLIDAFNRGFNGELDELVSDIVAKSNGQRAGLNSFINELRSAGCLTDSQPQNRFTGEDDGVTGTVNFSEVIIATPTSLICQGGKYLWYNHEGTLLLKLSLAEVTATAIFTEATSVSAAKELYMMQEVYESLNSEDFDMLVARLAGANLFSQPPEKKEHEKPVLAVRVDAAKVQAMVDARVVKHDEKAIDSGKNLVQVVPVNTQAGTAPASLGLLVAYAKEYQGGRLNDRYDFVPMFLIDESRIVERGITPGVFIFSNYLWTVEDSLRLSAAVKAVNPANITIHGGPSTPSYEKDCEQFFLDNPHVDIAVRGEGELTFSDILDKLDIENAGGLDVLKDVEGLTYRGATGVVRTGNRDRIADLNTIPSPYLTGLFDEFGSVSAGAVIETNRGCPYGCTFCDWGSATLSKVRRFELDRVYAELEWSAKNQIQDASIADANFGMLARDVAITEKIAELKSSYGYPRSVGINYAKNQVKYLRDIIRIMAEAGILTEGKVSLQSMDETTLQVIDRANIKLDKYNELATEFRRADLPLAVEIMVGLPGATSAAFHNDLQQCTNRDVRAMLNNTTLLPNSPMNDPAYRKEHAIVAAPGEMLKETASYTREEWEGMNRLKIAYYLFDSYGLLRYVARFIRSEKGIGEVEFYDSVQKEARKNPGKWPVISTLLSTLEEYMAPPGSWGLYINEVQRYMVDHVGMNDDSALRTVLAVQHAQLPAADRQFPDLLELGHDFSAWWDTILVAREEGHRDDWEQHAPKLSEFAPGTLNVEDPNGVCLSELGKPLNSLLYSLRSWELDSSVARPRLGQSFANWG
ncbi:MAG: radical SAM protein [Halioglobus sp.]|jgi:radical SAM superfamily enzyme YgiQ (UPF0313 family)|tara:strand:+ start:163 stop:2706 length:2544 start_codon:yes stop_codon:yes gene_type:complete